MQQLELLSIDNPCINVCQSDKRGYCMGCFRNRDERFNWSCFTPQQKRKVIELCKQRGQRRKAKAKKIQQQEQLPLSAHKAPEKEKEKEKDQQSVKDMGLDLFDL
jgi:predicted Fe-S protein YdhL (DUF1289 family)